MKISDLLGLAFDNLKRRKGRTVLTVLGVVIGTCSIVMMVSIGVALDKQTDDMMSNLGDLTVIEVYNWGSQSGDIVLNDETVASFQSLPNVVVATPIYRPRYLDGNIVAGRNDRYTMWPEITGMYLEAIEPYGYEIEEGRHITSQDKEYTAIVGSKTAYNFMDSKKRYPNNMIEGYPDENGNIPDPFVDMLNDDVAIKSQKTEENSKEIKLDINVVGIMKENPSKGYETMYGFIMDLDDVIAMEKEYMKANNIKDDRKNGIEYDRAVIKVDDVKNVDTVMESIKNQGYTASSPTEWRDEMKKQTQAIQLILGGLGSISLLVAAIGIANTMTMAIYERTKEIGVMKVLGCDIKDIKNMFLAEAAGIGLLGGIFGIIVSFGLSALLNVAGASLGGGLETKISIIPVWLVALGISFSTVIGIISGYMPAVRAVKITALSAIRHD